ncbi:hybrid sensor histidine kinase/response regulator [Anaerolineales bacterium HSG25]|nr:hybrid sensor histidine kinase/response regulator [Anaerolineales bacterium HSG25]
MGISENIRQQLIESFKSEQVEHVQKINQGLLALEKNPTTAERQMLLQELFREAHSLKGAARSVGMTTIESIGHGLEDILLQVKEQGRQLKPELFDLLYQALDAVGLMIERVDAGQTTAPATVIALLSNIEAASKNPDPPLEDINTTPPPSEVIPAVELNGEDQPPVSIVDASDKMSDPSLNQQDISDDLVPNPVTSNDLSRSATSSVFADETIRVSVNKLDTLMAQFSELLGTKIRIEQRLAEVRDMQNFATQWHKEWLGLRGNHNRLTRQDEANTDKDVAAVVNFTSQTQDRIRALNVQSNVLYRQLSNDAMRLSLVIDELQEEIKRIRMLPLTTITTTFERMVRDLARQQKKLIRLNIVGGETELDKRVLEEIKDPLMHLLRNAVDHGIDTPKQRQQVGKQVEGCITLSAKQQGHNVVITVSDDGAGLDLEAIRHSAMQSKQLTTVEARKLTDHDTAMLIFSSGLSTSKIITDISGRGVGLDVVRQNVAELHGTLNVSSEPKQGTIFTITLPLTLASSRGLLVRVSDQIYALPFSTVERMLEVNQTELGRVEGREVITYQGQAVGVVWLEDLLELPVSPRRHQQKLTVVVVAVAEKRLGLIVNSLEGEQEIVMKNMGKQLVKVSGIAGATVLGSGEVVLVLHTADLVKLANHTQSRTVTDSHINGQNSTITEKRILVVDDSITTRTLEKNILEAAGYNVDLATNGQEALSLLMSEGLPNLVVSDINMPYLDGFSLTEKIKADSRYSIVPVILVTSLDSPADKARGIEVGADAYIVKSNFDQGNLLETIEQLV